MKKLPFTGSGVAVVTPFKNGSIDFDKMGELVEMHIAKHTDAIIVCGTTGESATMPDAEHISVVEYCVQKAAGRIPIVAGAGSNDTSHGVQLSAMMQKVGADALLSVTPYYNKATQKGLIRHYTEIAKAVDIPIILYNVPSRTGVNIDVQTLLALSEIENIVGVKEAGGNISQVAKIAAVSDSKIIRTDDFVSKSTVSEITFNLSKNFSEERKSLKSKFIALGLGISTLISGIISS